MMFELNDREFKDVSPEDGGKLKTYATALAEGNRAEILLSSSNRSKIYDLTIYENAEFDSRLISKKISGATCYIDGNKVVFTHGVSDSGDRNVEQRKKDYIRVSSLSEVINRPGLPDSIISDLRKIIEEVGRRV